MCEKLLKGLGNTLRSVEAGTTDRNSAIVILMQIYGFDETTANGILGNGN